MKHLLLDSNIILDLWLARGNYAAIENLIEKARNQQVLLWFSSSSLGIIEYVLTRELQKRGAEKKRAKAIAKELLSLLLEDVSLLTTHGFEQDVAIQKAYDLEDAQTALAFANLNGDKRVVTHDLNFDTLDLVQTCTVNEAFAWITSEPETAPVDFIDLKSQQDAVRPQLEKNIHTVLHHGRYILGPEVKELEKKLCQYTGARHCIGVSSGTDALLMALMAWEIGPGDAVFTTPFTFIATAEVIRLLGATPVFVDIDPRSFNIDPQKLRLAVKAIKENDPTIYPLPSTKTPLKAKAIIPVDLFGLPADYDPVMELAKEYNLKVLADSAQGFGSQYKGRKSGTLGHATAASFFPAKPLGCYGDGGAVFTDDDGMAEILVSIRMHGKGKDKYDNVRLGLNARLHTMQAAILLAKLDIFDKELAAKQQVAQTYTELITDKMGMLKPPHVPQGLQSAWAQYSLLAEDGIQRDAIQSSLKHNKIPSMVYYPKPLHMQTAFASLGYKQRDFPISTKTSERIFSLPMHGSLQKREIEEIVTEMVP